jgi:drug/metabolite transporter (DMT)-like permease
LISGYFFALLASVLWGFNGVLVRKALEKVNPFLGTFYIVLISWLCLFILSVFTGEIFRVEFEGTKVALLCLAGIFQYFFGRTLTYFSVGVVGSSRAFTGTSTRIMFSALLGFAILGEEVNLMILSGILVMVAGLYILSSDTFNRRGLAISIAGGLSYGIASIFIKSGILESVVVSNLISVTTALPFIFAVAYSKSSENTFSFYLLLSGITMFLGTFSYYLALSQAQVVVAVPVSNLYPVFTTVFSYLLIQRLEHVSIKTLIGSVIAVMGGILIYAG